MQVSTCFVFEDGKTAFSGSDDGTVCQWDTETGKLVRVMGLGQDTHRVQDP